MLRVKNTKKKIIKNSKFFKNLKVQGDRCGPHISDEALKNQKYEVKAFSFNLKNIFNIKEINYIK